MSSTAGLNALASTTAIDIYKRNLKKSKKALSQRDKVFTLFWGVAILFCKCRYPIRKPNPTGKHRRFHILRNGTGNFLDFTSNSSKPKPSLQCPGQPNHHFLYILLYICFPAGEKLGYLWLNFIGAMLTIVLSPYFNCLFSERKG
jgi:hypothetical protein